MICNVPSFVQEAIIKVHDTVDLVDNFIARTMSLLQQRLT